MREIVLDTETTGMEPDTGDRIIEIGCVELENHVPTGKTLQLYINPEREVPADAIAVHGITNEFLKDKPTFIEVYSEFEMFIKGAKLVIHNAAFDMKFINHHFAEVGVKAVDWKLVVDTLDMARKKFPGSPANLDALCRRFGIDNTERTYHGALLDSELLAEVYLELLGGRQHMFGLSDDKKAGGDKASGSLYKKDRLFREPRAFTPSEEELTAHKALCDNLNDALWNKIAN
jgi:DNA polymerase-3 subunit epsilon